ncbi:TetR/AcrR family transcriptional regulator [Pseudonocardia kujensis]|uniref:TetR/AcrR family transcriptional regulator n=1 Tax=Pseudonocardia kujensis TaxID=1128675 RepID=UPI001E43B405|nr:TetR/AcrR family transcriptional regulator [Pseudonocardia kujensis]MCE0767727.1 TetR/AcrR family transcriptional regulator [Pseudonocardia kujensis]
MNANGDDRATGRSSAAKNISLREAQRDVTRQRIIQSASELFAEVGYTATTLEDVASRAGVSRGTIYLHYKNKAQLLRAVYESVAPELAAFLEQLRGPKTRAQLEEVFGRVIEWWAERFSLPSQFIREAALSDEEVREWFLMNLESNIATVAAILEAHGVSKPVADGRALVLGSMWSEAAGSLRLGLITPRRRVTVRDAFVDLFMASCRPSRDGDPESARQLGESPTGN